MAAEDCQKAGLDSLLTNPFGHRRGDLVETLASGLDFEGVGGLLQMLLPFERIGFWGESPHLKSAMWGTRLTLFRRGADFPENAVFKRGKGPLAETQEYCYR